MSKIFTAIIGVVLFYGTSLIAKPLEARITLNNGTTVNGYLVKYGDKAFAYSNNRSGSSPKVISIKNLKSISISEPPENWSVAYDAWKKEEYSEASRLFSKIANDHKEIALRPNGYGAKARYYEIMSYKKSGDFRQLDKAFQNLRKNKISLQGYLKNEMRLVKAWSLFSNNDWANIIKYVGQLQSKDEKYPRPKFIKGISRKQIAELSFLRGSALIETGETDKGLEDLQRAIAIDFGSDHDLTAKSAKKVLDTLLAKEDQSEQTLLEGYGTATVLKSITPSSAIDSKYEVYLEKPKSLNDLEKEAELTDQTEK